MFLECYFCGERWEAKPLSEFYFSSAFQRRCLCEKISSFPLPSPSTRRASFQRILSLHQNNELAVSNDSSVLLCRRGKAFPTSLISVVSSFVRGAPPTTLLVALNYAGLLHYKHRIHERELSNGRAPKERSTLVAIGSSSSFDIPQSNKKAQQNVIWFGLYLHLFGISRLGCFQYHVESEKSLLLVLESSDSAEFEVENEVLKLMILLFEVLQNQLQSFFISNLSFSNFKSFFGSFSSFHASLKILIFKVRF